MIAPLDIPQHRISSLLDKASFLGSITQGIGKTMTSVQKVIGKDPVTGSGTGNQV